MAQDYFFADSIQHYTTDVQGEDKWARMDISPQAGTGAFGQPSSWKDDYRKYNFAAVTTLEISCYINLVAQYGLLLHYKAGGGPDDKQCAIEVRSNGSLGFCRFSRISDGGTLIAETAAGVLQFNVDHHLFVSVDFSTTVGGCTILIDGVEVMNTARNKNTCWQGAGVEYCDSLEIDMIGNTNDARGNTSHIALAHVGSVNGYQPRVTASFAYQDGGDETGAQTGGSAGDAYTTIDETSPDDTDYLDHDAGERNSFLFNAPSGATTVFAIQSVARVFKTDADVVTARPYVKISGTRYYGTTVGVPANAAYLTYVWNQNPATASAWILADFPVEVGWERVT